MFCLKINTKLWEAYLTYTWSVTLFANTYHFVCQVDLFKKTLLLIPIHLEVHWSLITVNIPNRIISFYDSQGIHFKFCVEVRGIIIVTLKVLGSLL